MSLQYHFAHFHLKMKQIRGKLTRNMKNNILTGQLGAKHLFAGQNIQHIDKCWVVERGVRNSQNFRDVILHDA